jgi:hypothetical protein
MLHPALSHPAEELPIQDSLDLSLLQSIAVSRLDRHLIDKLNRHRRSQVATNS